ncbi:MAG: hypothetical protein LBJ57_01920 [Prevotellaceae bacterium]|nr:hypothetical protein [Prevotellaceae bacterium]
MPDLHGNVQNGIDTALTSPRRMVTPSDARRISKSLIDKVLLLEIQTKQAIVYQVYGRIKSLLSGKKIKSEEY